MPQTGENVSKEFDIPRAKQDEFAARSHQRAVRAADIGHFAEEIVRLICIHCSKLKRHKVPLEAYEVTKVDGVSTRLKKIMDKDDGLRRGTTAASLANVRSSFPQWGGTVTGGNASQLTDGAASVVLMKRSKAERLGLRILGKHVATTIVGLAPRIMGIGASRSLVTLTRNVCRAGLRHSRATATDRLDHSGHRSVRDQRSLFV
jgi:acetyl-CoA acyltransferase 1